MSVSNIMADTGSTAGKSSSRRRVFAGRTQFHDGPGRPAAIGRAIRGEPFVGIHHVNAMPPFLMSLVSDGNVWTFLGSNGAFTSGRGDADHALFPYRTADKILSQAGGCGARTHLLVERDDRYALWEPWLGDACLYRTRRNLFKSHFGTAAVFEEINEDLNLRFTWTLTSSNPSPAAILLTSRR